MYSRRLREEVMSAWKKATQRIGLSALAYSAVLMLTGEFHLPLGNAAILFLLLWSAGAAGELWVLWRRQQSPRVA